MKKHKYLTEEERKEVVGQYKDTELSMNQLAKLYNVDQTTISCILKQYNVEIVHKIGARKRRFNFDEHYFDVIDNEHKAYWLGWLYSDGNNFVKKSRVSLTVQSGDREILEKLKEELSSNYILYERKSKNKNRKDATTFQVISKYFSENLINLGVISNKSLTLQFPTEEQIPKHLLRHWLRGMIDGDGCISLSQTKKKTRFVLSVSLTGTSFICYGIKDFLLKDVNITSSIYQPAKSIGKTTRTIQIGGNKNAYNFLEWLYFEASISLKRKYNKYLDYTKMLIDSGWRVNKQNNKRQRMILYKGVEKNISNWAKYLNVKESLIRSRLDSGWSIEKTMTTPNRNKNKNIF